MQYLLHNFGLNWLNVLESGGNYCGSFFTECNSNIMVYFFKSSVIKKINSRPFASIKVLIWRKFFFTVIFYINTSNSIQRMFFVPLSKKLPWMLILASSKWVAKKVIPGSIQFRVELSTSMCMHAVYCTYVENGYSVSELESYFTFFCYKKNNIPPNLKNSCPCITI